ncbi:MAG: baseplate multidomain protein megatron [Beijerinckiaceae bacterium]
MATLVLQVAGSVFGSMIGGPVGGMIGRAVGAVAGASIDSAILNAHARPIEGPRLSEMPGLGSTEGAPVPRIYGRARVGGELIWATRFEEVVTVRRERGGSSGGKGAISGGGQKVRTYSYFANFAVGLCEGEIAFVRRVWADGKPLDLTKITTRLYRGSETQMPDALIVAKEGADHAPAYRGLAYIVFERIPLTDFGNRIPQLAFEIVRPAGRLAASLRGVNIIPGAGEFAYATEPVYLANGTGTAQADNRNQLTHASDFEASLDQLAALCPQLDSVTLIVAWFGNDLRAGHCEIRPKVDRANKNTRPLTWRVSGITRESAQLVSTFDDRPSYGGTPSDNSVIQAIQALRSRGLKVNLHPFIMMDIAAGNALPNPWTGAAAQPAYPWRGDLTVDPAPGMAGTVDKTAAAEAQIKAFAGECLPQHFLFSADTVHYSGPDEWSFRRFIFHYAHLANAAGGIDGFILGSELRSLTRVRGHASAFPMVDALVALAADVRGIIGPLPALTYGADWTEYGGVVPEAGTLLFPLDALWAAPEISCIGIDWYPPLSDWRDGDAHEDTAIARSATDQDYLSQRAAAGEAYDWFYASEAARQAQIRTPITDGAYNKPWVYRAKDIAGWWLNPHRPRVNGVETAATAWVPQSKPVWLLEIGCPAVDRGANAPNVFPDAKSGSAGLPPFSRSFRDDLVQARAVMATLAHFNAAGSGAASQNPVSSVYAGRMIDESRIHAWAWDARPFPDFPDLATVWGDSENFERGHWLNGRLEGAPLDEMLRVMAQDFDIADLEPDALDHFVDGYVIDRPMSWRAAAEPLARLFGFGLSNGRLKLTAPSRAVAATLTGDDVVPDRDQTIFDLRRAQETELPAEFTVGFSEAETEFRRATVTARKLTGQARRQQFADTALVARRGAMQRLANMQLQDAWIARETAMFSLPMTRVEIETGDCIALAGMPHLYQVQSIRDGETREISARAIAPAIYDLPGADLSAPMPRALPAVPGIPQIEILDIPVARGEPAALQYVAAFADPWPGAIAIWRRAGETEFVPHEIIPARAIIGTLLDDLPPGPVARWDQASTVRMSLSGGSIASLSDADALAGGNIFAIRKNNGAWEIVTAAQAVLEAPGVWRLSRFLRGLGGSEFSAAMMASAGTRIVKLDQAVVPLSEQVRDIGQSIVWRFGPDGIDHADPRMVEYTVPVSSLVLQPLPPVHIRARRQANGIAMSWIRQTRGDGDNWELADVPLSESLEAYDVEILDMAGIVKRTLTASSPHCVYSNSDEIMDFGAQISTLHVAVYQRSEIAGRGQPRIVQRPIHNL